MSTKANEQEAIEREKIIFRKVIAPNLARWFSSTLVEVTYRNDDQTHTIKYLPFEYLYNPNIPINGLNDTNSRKKFIALIVEGKAGTYSDRWEIRKHIRNGDSNILEIESLHTVAMNHSQWNRNLLTTLFKLVSSIPEYTQLLQTLDIESLVAKTKSDRSKAKEYALKRKVVRFTFSSQCRIAKLLWRRAIEKTDNYLLKLLDNNMDASTVDVTGQSLLNAIEILGLSKAEIMNILHSEKMDDARRFAALFGESKVAALLDTAPEVRLAAQIRRTRE